jgi:hypothetical protein
MAKQAAERRRAVTFGTTAQKTSNGTPIAVELLNRARHRKSQTKSKLDRSFLEKVSMHSSKPTHEPKTFSVAGLFKRNGKQGTRNGRNRRKEPPPEPNMLDIIQGTSNRLLNHVVD